MAPPGRKLRVVQVVEAATGGVRRHVLDLLRGVSRDRCDMSLVCSLNRDPGFRDDVATLRADGIPVTVIPMVRPISPVQDAVAVARLCRHFRRSQPDIVHTHSSKAGFVGRLAARLAGVPTILYTPHCFAFDMAVSARRRHLYVGLERLAARWTARLLCVCPEERDCAVAAQVAAAENMVVIPNGVPATAVAPAPAVLDRLRTELGIPAGARVIGSIGRLTPQKGYATLLQASRDVLSQYPDTVVLILGDGEQRAELEHLSACLNLRTVVLLPGQVDDIWPCYGLFEVFVMPSRWEALPYALLEAMMAARSVVATRVGGMPGVVLGHAPAGVLVPPGDAPALAAAISGLLAAPERAATLAATARKVVQQYYGLADMVRQVEALYHSLATGAGVQKEQAKG